LQRHEKVKIGEFRGKHEHCRWHSNCIKMIPILQYSVGSVFYHNTCMIIFIIHHHGI